MLEQSVYMITYVMVQEEMASLRHSAMSETLLICVIWGSHSYVEEDSSLIKRDAVWIVI